jgi:hypothetical protein
VAWGSAPHGGAGSLCPTRLLRGLQGGRPCLPTSELEGVKPVAFPAGPVGPGNSRPPEAPQGRARAGIRDLLCWSGPGRQGLRGIPGTAFPVGVGSVGCRAAGRQESSWIRESCWQMACSTPVGRRLLCDLGPLCPAYKPQFPRRVGGSLEVVKVSTQAGGAVSVHLLFGVEGCPLPPGSELRAPLSSAWPEH